MYHAPTTWQEEEGEVGVGGCESPICEINSWDESSAESPSLSTCPWDYSVWVSERNACQKQRLGNLLNGTKKSKYHVDEILQRKAKVSISTVNVRKLPQVGKRYKRTHSQSSANPIQTEDTAHSWISWSKQLKTEDNQSKSHVSWCRNNAWEVMKLCKVLWKICTYSECSLAVV